MDLALNDLTSAIDNADPEGDVEKADVPVKVVDALGKEYMLLGVEMRGGVLQIVVDV